MPVFENPVTFVRALKGAPASILWAFLFARHAMTALEISEWTGYKGDNITVALRLLVNLGWLSAQSARGPWCLVEGRQLPLMAESDLIGFDAPTTTTLLLGKENKTELIAVVSKEPTESDLIGFARNHKACLNMGIGEPKATEIAKLEFITPDLIRDHVRDLQGRERIGLAIRRLESGELPRSWIEEIRTIQRPEEAAS